jgi:uncharacterized membrane protein YkvA (DUF1232 family)
VKTHLDPSSKLALLIRFWGDIRLLFGLIRDYIKGIYRDVSWLSIAAVVVMLLYMVSPLDLMTDAIPIAGWLDDVAVIVLCLKLIRPDLEKYRLFRERSDTDGTH